MRNFLISSLIVFMIFTSIYSQNNNQIDELIIQGKALVQEGFTKLDGGILIKARAHFERLLQQNQMPWLIHYYLGYIDYRLNLYFQSKNDNDSSIKYLDDGIQHLKKSIQLKEDFAESHALLSILLGQKISTDPSLGMQLGPEAGFELQRAQQLDKDNPRVAFISAMSTYFTPPEFGGSKIRAIEEMKEAIHLFEKQKTEDPRLPDWGHAEAHLWLARFYIQENQWERAQIYLEQALKIEPDSQFAKIVQEQLKQQQQK